jgi:hypothetical protein
MPSQLAKPYIAILSEINGQNYCLFQMGSWYDSCRSVTQGNELDPTPVIYIGLYSVNQNEDKPGFSPRKRDGTLEELLFCLIILSAQIIRSGQPFHFCQVRNFTTDWEGDAS